MAERQLRFKSFDGIDLEGTLAIPKETDAHVVLVHGIDSDREEYGFFTRMADALERKGIATLRFDWRCFGYDSERPLTELTLAGLANDIEAAASAIRRETGANELDIVAASFGGGVAVAWSRHTDVRVRKIALLAPVLNYSYDYLEFEGLGTTSGGVSDVAAAQLAENGTLVTSGRPFSRQLVAEFPYFSASPLPDRETLIIHGTEDTGVPYANSERFVQQHPTVQLKTFRGVEHGFAAPGDEELEWAETMENHEAVYTWLVDFIKG